MQIPLELYKGIHKSVPIPCVDIVVMNGKGSILLAKRKNKPVKGQWWFPGGRVLKGETRIEAAKRKAFEELNIDVDIVAELGTEDTIFEDDGPFGWTTHTINSVYLAKILGESDFKLDEQHSDYAWFAESNDGCHPYIISYFRKAKEYGKRF